jgi:hypothetical protein
MVRQVEHGAQVGTHEAVSIATPVFSRMNKRSRAEARDRSLFSLEIRCYQPTEESVSHVAIVASALEQAVSVA